MQEISYNGYSSSPWKFKRHIIDHLSGRRLYGEGQCHIQQDIYHESGAWHLEDGTLLHFTRQYKVFFEKDDKIQVTFIAGGTFMVINPHARVSTGRHLCKRDVYDMSFKAISWARFYILWQVQGPYKHYISRTLYRNA